MRSLSTVSIHVVSTAFLMHRSETGAYVCSSSNLGPKASAILLNP